MKFKPSLLIVAIAALGLTGCFGFGGIDSGKTEAPMAIKMETGQQYNDYSEQAESNLRSQGQAFAVFFHAESCGTCRKNDAYFQKNLKDMPASTHILKVDYDTASTALKKKYQITKYDSIAYVNADGSFVTKKGVRTDDVAAFFDNVVAVSPEEQAQAEAAAANAVLGAPEPTSEDEQQDDVAEEPATEIVYVEPTTEAENAALGAPDDTPVVDEQQTEVTVTSEEQNANLGAPDASPESSTEQQVAAAPTNEEQNAALGSPDAQPPVQEAEIEADHSDAVYTAYSAQAVNATKELSKPYALFFHAAWCPPCRNVDKEINEKLGTLPEGTIIFKVDYDDSADLKQAYGVTSQHTLVTFDAAGEHLTNIQGFDINDIKSAFRN